MCKSEWIGQFWREGCVYKGERFNSISHLIGALAALIGLVLLLEPAWRKGDSREIVCLSVYGFTLFLFYCCSVLYHSLEGKAKKVFRKLDHISIYLLIAGTYTPVTLILLRGGWGWFLFCLIWCLAVIGIAQDMRPRPGRRVLSVVIYLFMGWFIVIALKPLLRVLPLTGFIGLLLGGIFYTVGVYFYAYGNKVNYYHGIWHLLVLAGSLSHYLTILLYVM